MRSPALLKQEFLKKWMIGLEACNSSKKDMGTLERKNAIKLSADIAMASTKSGSTCWSRAIIANASTDDNNTLVVKQILGPNSKTVQHIIQQASPKISNKRIRCNKILKMCRRVMRRVKKNIPHGHYGVAANSIAKRIVRKRTKLLKSLVPGGEFMNEVSLIKETLDYIVSLRAQVDVMQCVVTASELVNHN